MNYYCLLTIPFPETEHYIEVGLNYDLPFHPNLTDEIEIMGYPSKINEIYYQLESVHNGEYAVIKLIAHDCLYCYATEEEASKEIKSTWKDLKEQYPDLILNCYSINPNV